MICAAEMANIFVPTVTNNIDRIGVLITYVLNVELVLKGHS